MPNNFVSVGNSNNGNICGGDLTINHSLPCKNGDGMLSHEDYQRLPYCNRCISSSRNNTYLRYQRYATGICSIISALLIGGFYFIMERLPNFMGVLFQKNAFINPFIPIFSTLTLYFIVFFIGSVIAKILGKKYNNQHLVLH